MTHFETLEDNSAPMRPLSFFADRVIEQIEPSSAGAEPECCGANNAGRLAFATTTQPISVVVSLRVYTAPATIDHELGVLFDPVDCSLYHGRQLLGRYSRIGVGRIAAFDASGRWLGDYRASNQARRAICRRWKICKHSIEVCEAS